MKVRRRPAGAGGSLWRDTYDEFKRRRQQESDALTPLIAAAAPGAVAAPVVPQGVNWLPLGPTVVMNGQTGAERQPVAGRVAGLAIGPGGAVIYAASANGGVFRSRDGALSWEAMDQIDLDPNSPGSASLICGAIAMDPTNPRRVFVGTGEGATLFFYSRRITGALPAYRGIGVLRTDDGGETWEVEASDLAGQAFFALALNPVDREGAVAATTAGLYRRKPQAGGKFEWVRVTAGGVLERGVGRLRRVRRASSRRAGAKSDEPTSAGGALFGRRRRPGGGPAAGFRPTTWRASLSPCNRTGPTCCMHSSSSRTDRCTASTDSMA